MRRGYDTRHELTSRKENLPQGILKQRRGMNENVSSQTITLQVPGPTGGHWTDASGSTNPLKCAHVWWKSKNIECYVAARR